MNHNLQDMMQTATRLTRAGRLQEATDTIQRMLRGDAAMDATDIAPQPSHAWLDADVIYLPDARAPKAAPREPNEFVFDVEARQPGASDAGTGEFISGTHTHAGLTRRYKLYIPPGPAGQPRPLVVMLHGCTQDPDDFAAGTAMNQRAREQGFFVLYPEQSQDANPSRCWNWFKHNHQQRGKGEPALIASLTQTVLQQHGLDARRVFIAGLSAGGAMAAIVAAAYPDIYAAVGVHSGLPGGAASNVAEALMVMKSGSVEIVLPTQLRRVGPRPAAPLTPNITIPTIVFHGDQDQTVHPRNGEQVIAAAMRRAGTDKAPGQAAGHPRVEHGVSARGRRYTRSIHPGAQGQAQAEHWLVHGAGHAWSGGQAAGSYTDAQGPDATREMLRFFFSQGG